MSNSVIWDGPIEIDEALITLHATTVTTQPTGMLPPETLRFRYSYNAQSDTLYLSDPNCDGSFQQSVGYLRGTIALKRDP